MFRRLMVFPLCLVSGHLAIIICVSILWAFLGGAESSWFEGRWFLFVYVFGRLQRLADGHYFRTEPKGILGGEVSSRVKGYWCFFVSVCGRFQRLSGGRSLRNNPICILGMR